MTRDNLAHLKTPKRDIWPTSMDTCRDTRYFHRVDFDDSNEFTQFHVPRVKNLFAAFMLIAYTFFAK